MATPEVIRDAVFSAASENSELLNTLAKTSEAPSIYNAHLVHLDRLEISLAEQTSLLESLKTQTESRFRSHQRYRDSVTKKWFYRATKMLAKFEAKAMSQEREYFAALGTQSKAEERCGVLTNDLQKATLEKEELEKVVKMHGDTHARIDRLYERLFKGPTPGFRDEDERENSFYASEEINEGVKEDIRRARRARSGLGVVRTYLGRAKSNMEYALSSAKESFFFFDEWTYWVERGDVALGLALEKLKATDGNLLPLTGDLLEMHQLLVRCLEAARIPANTVHTKEDMIRSIPLSLQKLSEADESVVGFVAHAKEVEQAGLARIRETARKLEDSRQELQQIRQGVFERVAGFGEAAPSYMECCDRADGFCNVPEVGHEHVHPEPEAAPPVPPPGYGFDNVAQTSRVEFAHTPGDEKTSRTPVV